MSAKAAAIVLPPHGLESVMARDVGVETARPPQQPEPDGVIL
jgi:hypothetical protein